MSPRKPHPELDRNLVLIGGRGCGKSSVAKRLARTNRNFMLFSIDALIRYESSGRTIPEIVAEEGWAEFREREFEVVRKLSAIEGGALIDTGGGVVIDVDQDGAEVYSTRKVDLLQKHGLVVYLRRDPAYLNSRIAGDPNRPQLSSKESFIELMERRDPWYRDSADLEIDCSDLAKDDVCEIILEWFYAELEVD